VPELGGEGGGAARVASQKAAAAGLADPRARGGRGSLDVRAQAARGWRPCRTMAGLGLEPESSSRSGMTPQAGLACQRSRRERRELARGGLVKEAGPAGLRGEGRKKRPGGLGRAGGRKGKERPGWAGPCGRKEGKRKARLGGPHGRKGGGMGGVGPGQKERKRERKRNAFKYI
jgi:hypothetical protein